MVVCFKIFSRIWLVLGISSVSCLFYVTSWWSVRVCAHVCWSLLRVSSCIALERAFWDGASHWTCLPLSPIPAPGATGACNTPHIVYGAGHPGSPLCAYTANTSSPGFLPRFVSSGRRYIYVTRCQYRWHTDVTDWCFVLGTLPLCYFCKCTAGNSCLQVHATGSALTWGPFSSLCC